MTAGTVIDELVARLARLPGATVGRGPRHPLAPDPAVAPRLAEFFEAYPAARRDAGYVEFQEKYAGALVDNPQHTMYLDILGFSDASTDMMELEEPVIDPGGFLLFAECIYHGTEHGASDMHEHDFAFSVTNDGVHRKQSTINTRSRGYSPDAEDFTNWLRDLVERDGRYPRPDVP